MKFLRDQNAIGGLKMMLDSCKYKNSNRIISNAVHHIHRIKRIGREMRFCT